MQVNRDRLGVLRRATGMFVAAAVSILAQATPVLGQLTIIPTYAANINSDPNAATIKATIGQAIAEYQSRFSNNFTVNITFQEGGGLGSSLTGFWSIPYASYRSALASHATTPDDALALSHVPIQTNSPVDNQANMWITQANARLLGLISNTGTDCTITLNTSIMNLDRTSINAGKYDLKAVAQHEIDEGLGLGSGLNFPLGAPRQSRPQDLWRYSGIGQLSYDTAAASSYLSFDGGITNLVSFNQDGGGDYGDWFSMGVHTPRVQDAFGTAGATPNLTYADPLQEVELRNLDVIGYTLVPSAVPEPTTLLLTGSTAALVGMMRLIRRRRSINAGDQVGHA